MEKHGIISKAISEWLSPIVLVKKKDNTLRFCVDYRKLNSISPRDQYPLPSLETILDQLGKSKYFSPLDLCSGYWQIAISESDKAKTAFSDGINGVYVFNVMPFGLSNAPASFQRMMDHVLRDFKNAVCYIDDVLIYSETFKEHIKHFGEVFELLRLHKLTLKPTKYSIF